MTLPRLILTGASGFVGRHLLEALCDDWTVYGIARRSQARCGARVHPNLTWFQVDIGDREALADVFGKIREQGGADVVVHLAAHYDFTGEDHPEYFRTNVDGLRNTLDLSVEAGVKQFFFSSSTAACELPPHGRTLDETSPPDGRHIYAQTKRIGETMVGGYKDRFTPVVMRFAAMFSDHCEYPPLYMFFETWLSDAWNRHVLGGKGESAIPYLHVADAVAFLVRLLERREDWKPREVLLASPDGATSHAELFAATMAHESAAPARPIRMPKILCGPGMWARDLAGRLLGARPFERPWMAEYIDTVMAIDASRTRARTGWAPRERLEILRRLPFLLENRRTYPLDWHRLNRAAMKTVHVPQNLRLYQLLERHQAELVEEYSKALDERAAPVVRAREPRGSRVAPQDDPPAAHERGADAGPPRPRRVLRRPRRAPVPDGFPRRGPLPGDRRARRRLHVRPLPGSRLVVSRARDPRRRLDPAQLGDRPDPGDVREPRGRRRAPGALRRRGRFRFSRGPLTRPRKRPVRPPPAGERPRRPRP